MFAFGSKKKRTRLLGSSQKDKLGLLLYVCPECNKTVGGLMSLEGHSIGDLKKELELSCPACGKGIIVENRG